VPPLSIKLKFIEPPILAISHCRCKGMLLEKRFGELGYVVYQFGKNCCYIIDYGKKTFFCDGLNEIMIATY